MMTTGKEKDFLRKNKKEIMFAGIGLLLAVILLVVFIKAVGFMGSSLGQALDRGEENIQATRFNLDGLKKLGLITPTSAPSASSTQLSPIPTP